MKGVNWPLCVQLLLFTLHILSRSPGDAIILILQNLGTDHYNFTIASSLRSYKSRKVIYVINCYI